MSAREPRHLLVEQDGAVLHVRLNRPDLRNALHAELVEELAACFASLHAMPGLRALVLSGQGLSFCAGADLDWMRTVAGFSPEQNLQDALGLADMLQALNACPVPTLARVHGAAFGGGIGLVACCDVAIAADDCRFAFSEAKLGLLPAVISPFVVARIGAGHARALFATAERFDAQRALRIGLVHHVVAAADLDAAVQRELRELLSSAPGAAAQARTLIETAQDKIPAEAREETAKLIARLRSGAEGREGVAAFLEKRKPTWVPPDEH